MAPTFNTMGCAQNTSSLTTTTPFSRLAIIMRDVLPSQPKNGSNWVIYGILIAVAAVIAIFLLAWCIRRRGVDKKHIQRDAEQAMRDSDRAFALDAYPHPAEAQVAKGQRQTGWSTMGQAIDEHIRAQRKAIEEMGVNPYQEPERARLPRESRRATFDNPRQTIDPPPGVIDPPRVRTPTGRVPTAAALAARKTTVDTSSRTLNDRDGHRKPEPLNKSQSNIPERSMSADVSTFRQAERRQKVFDNLKNKAPAKTAKPSRPYGA